MPFRVYCRLTASMDKAKTGPFGASIAVVHWQFRRATGRWNGHFHPGVLSELVGQETQRGQRRVALEGPGQCDLSRLRAALLSLKNLGDSNKKHRGSASGTRTQW